MKYFIIEESPRFLKKYGVFLEQTFNNMKPVQYTEIDKSLEAIQTQQPVFSVVDPFFHDVDPFLYLDRLSKCNIPFVLILDKPSNRFVVEAMKMGAADIIDITESDENLVRDILIRTYLDVERWTRMHRIRLDLVPPGYVNLENNIQNRIFQKREDDVKNYKITGSFTIGQPYKTVFAGITVRSDQNLDISIINNQYSIVRKIQESRGGLIWPDRVQTVFSAFVDQDPRIVVEWMLEIYSDFSDQLLSALPGVEPLVVIGSSVMIYKEDLSTVYSPAINRISHVLKNPDVGPGFLITGNIYRSLSPFQQSLFPEILVQESEKLRKISPIRC